MVAAGFAARGRISGVADIFDCAEVDPRAGEADGQCERQWCCGVGKLVYLLLYA
jgi:hypothetical protein